uniref:Cohesin loading complex subunit SCC4 homolog n=1 Tax=Timema genevievae TaxID=629358 RepID=A0A7R9KBH3_TIMGE|nr:unnamed protein product [Timema genevievae]
MPNLMLGSSVGLFIPKLTVSGTFMPGMTACQAWNEGSDVFDICCHAWNDKADNPKLIFRQSQHDPCGETCQAQNDSFDMTNLPGIKRSMAVHWLLSQMINAFDDVKFEAASVLAELYEQQSQSNLSKPILRKAIELSQHSVYWHCRLIFQLAQIHATERDYELASSLLGVGVDYAHISSAFYTRVLFLLSRCMVSID